MRCCLETTCRKLKQGEVVALPTETVYGLAASLQHPEAINQIFILKGRPKDNPLIVHGASFSQLEHYCEEIPSSLKVLTETFWPGPLTIVLKAKSKLLPTNVTAGLQTVALRVPKHPLTLKVLEDVGPLVMPSANLSGKPSATRVEHVEMDFGIDFPILDGEKCSLGIESTVVIHKNGKWQVVRMGSISFEELQQILGYKTKLFSQQKDQPPISPGQKYRHYAPSAILILDQAISPESIGVVLGFKDRKYPTNCRFFELGYSFDAGEVSKNLYHVLRRLDDELVDKVWVDMNFPQAGLWLTIAERLIKASV
jgi:L-threonylcarbamoyladenylate synthase